MLATPDANISAEPKIKPNVVVTEISANTMSDTAATLTVLVFPVFNSIMENKTAINKTEVRVSNNINVNVRAQNDG